ncbi:MAG: class I SAM-dependent methyltransferase [Chloroflexota bacterium]|nr:class I SAM-dependent methyltransferase [Chloroflexota bacterium]MDQ5864614.1 class I SAM-dependent methyltransferase [Chloroflexota bacterium]
MEFEEYRIMREAEDVHWWYRGLRGVMFTLLSLDKQKDHPVKILDAGCGTGGNIAALEQAGFPHVLGFDYSSHGIHFCRERGLDNVCQGSLMSVPFRDNSLEVVISCDVINDEGLPDEIQALGELYRVLAPGGRLFLNLPAYNFLRGEHDKATSVARRYTTTSITEKLRSVGFKVQRVTYWNMFLFPLVLAVRLASRLRGRGEHDLARSDIKVPSAPINSLLTALLRVEHSLLRRVNLPFGSSVSVVAVKPRRR